MKKVWRVLDTLPEGIYLGEAGPRNLLGNKHFNNSYD